MWLAGIAAAFLLYMAWYVYQSDGTEYYVSSDYEVTEYVEITNGRFETQIEYPEKELRRIGLTLTVQENAAEDAQLLVELTGDGVAESWIVTAGEVTSGETTWLILENPDIREAQTLRLVLSVSGEDNAWQILVGSNPAEETEGEDAQDDAAADAAAGEDSGNTGVVYCALVSSVSKVVIYLIAALVAVFIFAAFAFISSKPSEEHLFLVLWLLLGTVYMIAQPVMSEADSRTHYYRSADVAEGRWVTEQDEDGNWIGYYAMPESWVDGGNSSRVSSYEALDYLDFSVDGETTLFSYVNTAVYSPFTYLPQAIGIFLAQLFTDRLMVIVYAGRISNFLLTGLVYWLAVRLMPFSKKYIIWAALIPMNLHEAVSMAPDAMVSALIALLMAAALYLRYDPKSRLTANMLVLLYVTAFLITQDKIVYVGACMLLFLIPSSKFACSSSPASVQKRGGGGAFVRRKGGSCRSALRFAAG